VSSGARARATALRSGVIVFQVSARPFIMSQAHCAVRGICGQVLPACRLLLLGYSCGGCLCGAGSAAVPDTGLRTVVQVDRCRGLGVRMSAATCGAKRSLIIVWCLSRRRRSRAYQQRRDSIADWRSPMNRSTTSACRAARSHPASTRTTLVRPAVHRHSTSSTRTCRLARTMSAAR
jgi:hypothetical protein